ALSMSLRLSCLLFLFFFSSRRRHTRLVSDWSSDVCSSDLFGAGSRGDVERAAARAAELAEALDDREALAMVTYYHGVITMLGERSEERRVGKECRYRWSRGE